MKINYLIKISTLLLLLFSCSDKKNNGTGAEKHNNNMSTNILKIISIHPSYIPTQSQQSKAQNLLTKLYNLDQIELATSKEIQFVDQGQNFDSVLCDLCGHEISIESWQMAMEKAYEKKFENLSFMTPCCDKNVSLNDLTYKGPAGFAKFVINIEGAESDINQNDLSKLEQILSTRLRIVWAHY